MRKFQIVFFILIMSTLSFGQKPLSLEEAVNIALQRNTLLQRSLNNLRTFESSRLAAYGNFLPDISAGASWNWTRSEDEGGTVNYQGIVIPIPATVSESRNYGANIGSNWVLFDGLSNFANLSRSQNDLESARSQLERLKEDVVFQTITLYYDVINSGKLLSVKEEDVLWNQKNLETIMERNRLGAVTLADVYAQQVRLGNAELEVIRNRNNLETAKSTLLYYLGLDVLTNYVFSDSLSEQDIQELESSRVDYEDLSRLVESALDNRKDYKSAQLNLESAQNGVTIARSGHLPRLLNSLSYNVRSSQLKNLFDSKTYFAGLTLSIPIFSGFSVYNQVEFAEVDVENRKVEIDELERQIKQNLQKTFLDLQAAEKSLDVNKRNVIAAEENRKIEQEKYSLGSGTLLNVLIANSEYTNAQTNFINSQFAYIVLSEQLKYFLGQLDYKNYE